MTLTDGKTEVEISKDEMEIILEHLHEGRRRIADSWCYDPDFSVDALICKLETLDY